MERIVEEIINPFVNQNNLKYIKQASQSKIKNMWNYVYFLIGRIENLIFLFLISPKITIHH